MRSIKSSYRLGAEATITSTSAHAALRGAGEISRRFPGGEIATFFAAAHISFHARLDRILHR
ncbi:hypothetical protein ABGB18_19695 [Nonomuraea sp. B12E4]|uniref:hypothetical protein n=1 Tax=Nonomuraea sp. B12E4 TaxID=3153564 RepID=UPI00325E4687